jgi:hypothetical protein
VTENRALKRAVRTRAARTGEKYTEARRALLADDGRRRNGKAPARRADPSVLGEANAEFDRQLRSLVAKGYAEAAGIGVDELTDLVEPLRGRLPALAERPPSRDAGEFLFALVVTSGLVATEEMIARTERRRKPGVLSMLEPDELARFAPIESVAVPPGPAYLIADIDTGLETRNVTPDAALTAIEAAGRSALTVDEGIALVTHYPEAVAKNAGFSLCGSRSGDRRVTAWWLSKGSPKLGWCWAGNPHTWLGSASLGERLGASRG